MIYVILLLLFLVLLSFVLFCCLAAGNDPDSQKISDMEQMEYIRNWREEHGA